MGNQYSGLNVLKRVRTKKQTLAIRQAIDIIRRPSSAPDDEEYASTKNSTPIEAAIILNTFSLFVGNGGA